MVCAVRDSRGFMWFCTSDGLSRFDGSWFTTYRAVDGLPISVINDMEESRDGRYWIATNGGGVCRFDPDATRPSCQVLKVGDTITTNRVNTLYADPVDCGPALTAACFDSNRQKRAEACSLSRSAFLAGRTRS